MTPDTSLTAEKILQHLIKYVSPSFSPQSKWIGELGICGGRVRADLTIIDSDELYGFEIKSDRDSLKRLSDQIRYYELVYDYSTVVVGVKHVDAVMGMLQPFWGVMAVDGTGRIFILREAQKNPYRNIRAAVEFLWMEDALELLSQRISLRGLRGKSRRVLWDAIYDNMDVPSIATAIADHLRGREVAQGLPQPV